MNAQNQNAQTNEIREIRIKIRGVEIQIPRKTVLYGPNGAGKSLVINGILAHIVGHDDLAKMVADVEGSAASVVKIDEVGIVQHGIKIFNRDVVSFDDWSDVAIADPEVASKLYIDVYYDKFYDPDRGWQPLSRLSYGERRRLAIEAALAAADVVLIENFEAGLHVDAVVGLVKQIAESDAVVVLETHSGLVLKAAVRFGISAYYIEPIARLKRIERLDDSELFARELSAWNAIVV
jgi:ABC-type branched-subunit amino acid transport system ATPase component